MIGRLVEHEQIGLHDEQAGQMGAHDPAAAEFAGGLGEMFLAVAEAGEHALGLGVDLRVGEGLVLGVGLEILGAGDVPGLLEFAQALFQRGDFAGPAGGDIERGVIAVGFGLLREISRSSSTRRAPRCPRPLPRA